MSGYQSRVDSNAPNDFQRGVWLSGAFDNTTDLHAIAWAATNIVKQFIEDYHPVLEQEYVFPIPLRYEQYHELIDTLLA